MGNEDKTEKIPFEEQVLEQLSSINSRLTNLETRFASMETRLESVETRFAGVETRLELLETKVDDRLRETRPIWEQALKEIMEVKEEVQLTNSQLLVLTKRDLRQDTELLLMKNRLDRMASDPNAPTSRLP